MKADGRKSDYDCVLGLSGGVDSSYVARLAVSLGLRPLVVHFDNGWNSELAVQNIESIITALDLDLETIVVDWEEFADLQRSYLRASVVDIEVPTDHGIFSTLFRAAKREKVPWVLTGDNHRTEFGMPPSWSHRKSDLRNLKAIHRAHGKVPLRTLPTASTLERLVGEYTGSVRYVEVLDLVEYDKQQAEQELREELGWRPYGGKHYESMFTRFYQAHILPTKFGIDKRRVHQSALVRAGQTTREAALAALEVPLYEQSQLNADRDYVLKKLELDRAEWDEIMAAPVRPHLAYASDERYIEPLFAVKRLGRRISRLAGRGQPAAPDSVGGRSSS